MSIIHVTQIKNKITELFDRKLDMSDVKSDCKEFQNFFLTRALSAYVIKYKAHASIDQCIDAITDGGGDNGIDAIYFDEIEKQFFIIQSKWIHDGTGEPSNGDVKKYIAGIKDLFNFKYDRFNDKIKNKSKIINQAVNDPYTKYNVILAYTGINTLADPSRRDFEDLHEEMNDASDVLTIQILNQTALHSSLTIGLSEEPINLDVGLKSWGKITTPHNAFYGHINATDIFSWWKSYNSQLFTKNLRGVLGDTDVNYEIRETLQNQPEKFWYFNNGITLIAKKITKTMAGGADSDYGTFHCEEINIVNGAQTVSTVGKFGESNLKKLESVFVPIRIISLEDTDSGFSDQVTKTNNRQNKIEYRDFVALDPEQLRIKTELAIDSITYNVMRTDSFSKAENAFDFVEGVTSLVCASGNPNYVVQLKREIGKLWEDLSKPPYKELFNPSTTGLYLWRCVCIQRKIDENIEQITKRDESQSRNISIAIHGNRLISYIVFNQIPPRRILQPTFDLSQIIEGDFISKSVNKAFDDLCECVDNEYPNSILPTLFKNMTKCKRLIELCEAHA